VGSIPGQTRSSCDREGDDNVLIDAHLSIQYYNNLLLPGPVLQIMLFQLLLGGVVCNYHLDDTRNQHDFLTRQDGQLQLYTEQNNLRSNARGQLCFE
jgi:hypothetical protein